MQLRFHREETFQQARGERTALAGTDHAQHGIAVERVLVNALAAERVVDIGQGDDLRPGADLVALEAVRVAAAVPALVVVAGDVVGVAEGPIFAELGNLLQEAGALERCVVVAG